MKYMKLEEKQLTHDLKYECFFMKLYEDEILLPNNKKSKRIYIMHNSAAAVLPVTKTGHIVLVNQYRYPIRSVSLEIPAGKKDYKGEDGKLCAMRELEEETGYGSNDVSHLTDIHSCVGYSNEMIELFIAKNCEKIDHPKPSDDDEFLEIVEYTPEELKTMLRDGKIKDAKTLVALQQYFLQEL